MLTILVLVIAVDYIDCHRLSSILIGNSRKRIPSIFRLAPGTCCIYSVCVRSNVDVILIECVVKGYYELLRR